MISPYKPSQEIKHYKEILPVLKPGLVRSITFGQTEIATFPDYIYIYSFVPLAGRSTPLNGSRTATVFFQDSLTDQLCMVACLRNIFNYSS